MVTAREAAQAFILACQELGEHPDSLESRQVWDALQSVRAGLPAFLHLASRAGIAVDSIPEDSIVVNGYVYTRGERVDEAS
jgi:hypothetical protein